MAEREAVIRYLSRPREYDKEIRKIKERIIDLRSSLTSISISYSDMPKGGSGPGSRVEDGIVGLLGLEEELEKLEAEKAAVIDKISEKIDLLPDLKDQEVLVLLYLVGESWEIAADYMECSKQMISIYRNRALEKLSDILGGDM